MEIQPYLFFEGRCEEAIEFYKQALGAEVKMLMRFKESPEPPPPGALAPGSDDKIMHACLAIGRTQILVSDGGCQSNMKFQGVALSLTVEDVPAAEATFAALAEGGQVQMPFTETFFAPRFGTVADRFGVNWMVLVATPAAAQAQAA